MISPICGGQLWETMSKPWSESLAGIREFTRSQGFAMGLFAHDDAYGNSFLHPADETLKRLSGFSGSAGLAIVSERGAALFVDGRYTLQAKAQAEKGFKVLPYNERSLAAFFAAARNENRRGKIGFDSFRHSAGQIASIKRSAAGFEFTPFTASPFVPARYCSAKFFADEKAAQPFGEKLEKVARVLTKRQAAALVIHSSASVAWLLNFRADGGVPYSPIVPARAVLKRSGEVVLFCRHSPPPTLRRRWRKRVRRMAEGEFLDFLRSLSGRVLVDKAAAPYAVWEAVANRGSAVDPCLALKAIKTPRQIADIKAVHIRDGAAVSRFLYSLEANPPTDELQAARRLHRLRTKDPAFWGDSFATISAVGANSAQPHYLPDERTRAALSPNCVYLVDSGGHYLDGTTDITRTVWLGPAAPPLALKRAYTLVLKGHIKLAAAKLTKGMNGERLDAIARRPLKRHKLDYPHSTGHGVGNFLSVHEFPPLIAKGGGSLRNGMVFSNEPAVYLKGRYGIRLENLIAVERSQLTTLTRVPFENSLIMSELLSASEKCWLNRYHQWVCESLQPLMPPPTLGWLRGKTAPLK